MVKKIFVAAVTNLPSFVKFVLKASSTLCFKPRSDSRFYPTVSLAHLD